MDDVLATLRQELAGRYSVEDEVGRGGMAVVYRARDIRHGRSVAIKVLRQDSTSATAAERFLREIQTVAQLHHPHILPLHDSGVAGDHAFYVMPFVEGESLRQRLQRTGPLTLNEAVQITREVADALSFAHDRGIVHRDIKPENILLSAGHATVADFGIARAINEAGFTAADVGVPAINVAGYTVTATGVAVGTPLYMSPEQASADVVLDGRTDQYSLGCVVYEMLTGEPPFSGATAFAILSRHTSDPMPAVRRRRADVTAGLEAALARAMAKTPAERWPTVREFAAAVDAARAPSRGWKRPAVFVGAALAVAALVWQFGPGAAPAAADPEVSVGVLPFTFSGDTAFRYLSDGLNDGLTGGLFRVRGLRTVAGGQAARFSGPNVDPQQAGRALGTALIVTVLVEAANQRIRVSPRILRVSDGAVLWSAGNLDVALQADGGIAGLFAIQDTINDHIVAAALPRLAAAQRAAASRGARTRSAEAWRQYLQARRLNNIGDSVSVVRAKVLLDSAVALDSTFSDAWTALAQTEDNIAHFSKRPPEDFKVAIRRALNRAVDYDSGSGYALAQRGTYKILNDWDWDQATADMRRALLLEPGSLDVEWAYQGLLMWTGQVDSAMARARASHDTLNANSWANMAFAFMGLQQWDSVLATMERANAGYVGPSGFVWDDLTLALAYLENGQRARADSLATRFLRRGAKQADAIGNLAVYFQRAGDLQGARLLRARLDTLRKHTTWSVHAAEAMVRVALGDRAGALAQMDSAITAREFLVPVMMIQGLDPLRDEPRFMAAKQAVWGNRTLPRVFRR